MSTNQESIDWYNQNAQNYTDHVRNPEDSIYHSLYEKPAMYSLLPELSGRAVLSLGCGSGEDSRYLKGKGAATSVGIDISENMIKIAQENPGGCEFQVMDMEKLDFPDNNFDLVYSSLAVHYAEDWTRLMQQAYRVLKPNGIFLFSCNHPVHLALKTGEYVDRRSYTNDEMRVTTWTKSFGEISSEVQQAGFLIDEIVEPKPDEKMREISSKDYDQLRKVPYFIIFKLLKP